MILALESTTIKEVWLEYAKADGMNSDITPTQRLVAFSLLRNRSSIL